MARKKIVPRRKQQKQVERICNNCKLYNPVRGVCSVVVLYEGERTNIPVDSQDSCFFEQECFDPVSGRKETLNEIQEVKFWVEDEKGRKPTRTVSSRWNTPKGSSATLQSKTSSINTTC